MLPNRMNLYKKTEDELKRLKQRTGVTPNVAARIAFCLSLEAGFRYELDDQKTDGTLNLDKLTWFGDHTELYEMLLSTAYPRLAARKLEQAWAAHVEAGATGLLGCRTLAELAATISASSQEGRKSDRV